MPTLTNVQQYSIGPVVALDRKGNPATLDGPLEFSSDNEAVATVGVHPNDPTPDAPTLFLVKAVPGGGPGAAQIRIAGDADLGDGVRTLELFSAANVVPEEAVGLSGPEGPVEDQ